MRAVGQRIAVRDILLGDVWVASGQSNMEWPVASLVNAAAEIASANDVRIREFAIPHSYSEKPEAEVVGGVWAHADSQQVGHFSAVAYFFARDLRKSVDVPIGIIHTSWGGANIETWMSRAALGLTDSAWRAAMTSDRAHNDSVRDALQARIGDLPTTDAGLVGERARVGRPHAQRCVMGDDQDAGALGDRRVRWDGWRCLVSHVVHVDRR